MFDLNHSDKEPEACALPYPERSRIAWASVLLVLLALTACQHIPTSTSERPEWASRPEGPRKSIRFISAVGTGDTALSREALLAEAEDAARTELAKELNRYARTTLIEFIRSHFGGDGELTGAQREFIQSVSTSTTNAILRRTVRHNTWSDEENNTVTVLYRIPIRNVHNAIQMEAQTAYEQKALRLNGKQVKISQKLAAFLDSRLKKRLQGSGQEDEELESSSEQNDIPAWLSRGHSKEFPPQKYIVATGLGENKASAHRSAQRYIHSQIQKRASAVISRLASQGESKLARDLQNVSSQMVAIEPASLGEIRAKKHWYDTVTGTYYLLAVMDRESAISQHRETATSRARQCGESYKTANNHYRAGNIRSAVQGYLAALSSLYAKTQAQLAIRVLKTGQPKALDLPATPPASTIKSKLNRTLDTMQLRAISGDDQWIAPESPDPAPLEVRLVETQKSKPLGHFPITFEMVAGKANLKQMSRTNEKGRARCTVSRAQGNNNGVLTVRCRLDLNAMTQLSGLQGLHIPTVSFRMMIRSPQTTWCVLSFRDEGDSKELLNAVSKSLRQSEYNVIPQKQLKAAIEKTSREKDDLRSLLSRAVAFLPEKPSTLVIMGQASPKIVEQRDTSEGVLYFAHVPVRVQIMDPGLSSDNILHSVSITGKGAYAGNSTKAIKRARSRAATLLATRITKWLDGKFDR